MTCAQNSFGNFEKPCRVTCRLSAACVERIIEVLVGWKQWSMFIVCCLICLDWLCRVGGLPSSFMLVSDLLARNLLGGSERSWCHS